MAKPRKGVVPAHLRPYLFKKRGTTVRSSRPRTVTVRVQRGGRTVTTKAVAMFHKIGGLGGIVTIGNTAQVVHLGQRLKNIAAHTGSVSDFVDQLSGQAGDAWNDVKSNAADVATPPAVIFGGKWLLNKFGISVPKWLTGDY